MKSLRFKHLFFAFIVFISIGCPLLSFSAETNPAKEEKAAPAKEQTTLIQVYSWATILPKELIDLQSNLAKEKDIRAIDEEITVLAQEAEALKKEVSETKKVNDMQLAQVANYQTKVHKITNRLKSLSEPILAEISNLSENRKEWQTKKEQILGFDKKELLALALGREQQKILVETIDNALQLIEEQLKYIWQSARKSVTFRVLLYSTNNELKTMDARLRAISTRQTSPSMLSRRVLYQNQRWAFQSKLFKYPSCLSPIRWRVSRKTGTSFPQFYRFLLIWFGMYKTKDLVSSSSRWYPFALYPLATTIFMVSSLNALIE